MNYINFVFKIIKLFEKYFLTAFEIAITFLALLKIKRSIKSVNTDVFFLLNHLKSYCLHVLIQKN